MNNIRALFYAIALTAFVFNVGRGQQFYPSNPFPERKGASCETIYEPPVMPWNTNGPSAWRAADKATTDDYKKYIQDHKITLIIKIDLWKDTNDWHAIQITEGKTPKLYVEHLLEYDKSDTRTKTRSIPWKDHAW